MNDAGAAIARFDFNGGGLRGTHLTLYGNCLVHQGGGLLETLPLAAIASVRVAFERDEGKLRWAVGLVIIAALLFAVSGPVASFAGGAAAEMAGAGAQGVARALHALFRLLEAAANLLPIVAALAALGGAALGVFGWLGTTRLTIAFAGYEREYPARGRDTKLLDFTELLASQVVSVTR